jgi:hypothetical protein
MELNYIQILLNSNSTKFSSTLIQFNLTIGLRFNLIEKIGMQIDEGIENVLMNIMLEKKN